jgi:hypothetical protein
MSLRGVKRRGNLVANALRLTSYEIAALSLAMTSISASYFFTNFT